MIKYERTSNRRMMMHFDREFLEMLPPFKRGLGGRNEMKVLVQACNEMASTIHGPDPAQLLDIGSGDGDWLKKLARVFTEDIGLLDAKFTALEPIPDNPELESVCRSQRFAIQPQRIEECDLEPGTFDTRASQSRRSWSLNSNLDVSGD